MLYAFSEGCKPVSLTGIDENCLTAGVISVSIAVAIGGPLGVAAGYFGGWTDTIISPGA